MQRQRGYIVYSLFGNWIWHIDPEKMRNA